MANYVCIRVIAKPVKGAEEDYKRLCEDLVEDPDGFIESIGADPTQLCLDLDNWEIIPLEKDEKIGRDEQVWFQMIARWNYPRDVIEEGFDNYVADYDVVFADEFETYDIDYSSDDLDSILGEVGCIGVYKTRRIPNEDPDNGYDWNMRYFFPQSEEEKHLMYLYAWAESYFCCDTMDRQALYHTDPEDPDNDFYDLREEMDLEKFFDSYKL